MHRFVSTLLAVAALSVPVVAVAQNQYASTSSDTYLQDQPAPIERHYAGSSQNEGGYQAAPADGHHVTHHYANPSVSISPIAGVRILSDEPVTTSNNGGQLEIHVNHGRANVSVDHPQAGTLILVDLPGGQADLTTDGFYTFNAGTNRLVVLHGDAKVFAPGAPPNAKGRSVHEGEEATLSATPDVGWATQDQLRADLVPMGREGQPQYADNQPGPAPRNDGAYAVPPPPSSYYGDEYPAYSYYYPAYYPAYYGYYGGYYPWGWDYAWGYPYGIGLGFGWYGGGWGGYRGGYYGGRYGYRGGGNGFHAGASGSGFHGGSAGGSHAGSGGHR